MTYRQSSFNISGGSYLYTPSLELNSSPGLTGDGISFKNSTSGADERIINTADRITFMVNSAEKFSVGSTYNKSNSVMQVPTGSLALPSIQNSSTNNCGVNIINDSGAGGGIDIITDGISRFGVSQLGCFPYLPDRKSVV